MLNPHSQHKLDFVCVGPQKTATTWLDGVLRHHAGVSLPSTVKETFYFDEKYDKGEAWYWKHFASAEAEKELLFGEVAPSYFDVAEARERLHRHNPKLKCIVVLRDPVDRAYSLYCHHYLRGRVRGSFFEAARQMPRLIESGRYSSHIAAWTKAFGEDRVLLLKQRDIQSRPSAVIDVVCSFLGLDAVEIDQGQLNAAANEKLTPANFAVSLLFYKISTALRKAGLHRVVSFVKGLPPVQYVMYGGKIAAPSLDANTRLELRKVFELEYRYLEAVDSPGPGIVVKDVVRRRG